MVNGTFMMQLYGSRVASTQGRSRSDGHQGPISVEQRGHTGASAEQLLRRPLARRTANRPESLCVVHLLPPATAVQSLRVSSPAVVVFALAEFDDGVLRRLTMPVLAVIAARDRVFDPVDSERRMTAGRVRRPGW